MDEGLSLGQKRDSHPLIWIISVVVVLIVAFIGYSLYNWYFNGAKPFIIPLPASAYADSSVDESVVTLGDIDSYSVKSAYPRYISIPSLGITQARIETVGLTKLNTLTMPKNINDVAWYQDSATPGQGYGQVVIDGYNKGVNHNGILYGLDKISSGDEITITRGDNKKFTYKVTKNVTLSIQQANSQGLQQLTQPTDTSKEGLGLMAPAGTWIPRDKEFTKRILVWATLES